MSANIRAEIKRLATAIAHELMEDLNGGVYLKIGIDEVRCAISAFVPKPLTPEAAELLEEQTLRMLIEKVG